MTARNPMIKTVLGCMLVLVFVTHPARAQQGHPLAGTWQGFWGENGTQRNFLTLIMRWDGKNIVGEVNPGPNAGSVRGVQLDSSTWTVRFDLDVPDRSSGDTVHLMGEGRLLNIGSPNRTLTGTLVDEPDSYFRISRQ